MLTLRDLLQFKQFRSALTGLWIFSKIVLNLYRLRERMEQPVIHWSALRRVFLVECKDASPEYPSLQAL